MTQSHRACSNVIPIEVAARGTKSSKNIDELLSQLSCIDKNLEVVYQRKIQNVKQLDDESKSIRNRVSQLRQKVLDRLDMIEKDLNEELSELRKTGKAKLERAARKIQQSQNLVNQHKEQIEFERKHGTDKQTFILASVVKEHLIGIEEKIFRIKNHSGSISIVFQENKDFLESVGNVGSVTLKASERSITLNEHSSISERNETFIQGFDFSIKFDATTHKDAMITGLAVTGDDRLLLCGGGKCNIIVCTFEGKHLQECKTAGEPWDIAIIHDGEGKAVTTLPYLYAIQFINTNSMAAGKLVKFEWRVYGIAALNKQIIVGGKNCLQILNTDGIKQSEVNVPSMNVFYIHPRENGDLYYSDCTYVYCMKPDGRHAFCQDVSTLESPRNIITDNRGNLLVAGHRSDNLHRLSSDGIAIDVPLSKKDGITGPFAICFSKDKKKLFVSNDNGKIIHVFDSIYANTSKEEALQELLRYL